MIKKLCGIVITVMIVQPLVFAAQTTLNFQNSKPTSSSGQVPIPPSDFANQVKASNTQNHAQFKQQLDQRKNELSHPTIPSLAQVQNMAQPQPPPALPPEMETSKTMTKPSGSSNKQPVLSSPPAEAQQPPPEMTPPSSSTATTAPPPPPANSSRPYTGFPTQNSSGTPPPSNGGGFNVKY
jgi:hypothetical protein